MVLKITKKDLENVAGWLLGFAIIGAIISIPGYFIWRAVKGDVVYKGKIDGRYAEYVKGVNTDVWSNNQLRFFGKDGKLKAIFKDGGNTDLKKNIDGDVDSIFIFDSRGRKKTIESKMIIDFDGKKYVAANAYESLAEQKAADTALAEGRYSLGEATQLYNKVTEKIKRKNAGMSNSIEKAKKAGSLDLNLGE